VLRYFPQVGIEKEGTKNGSLRDTLMSNPRLRQNSAPNKADTSLREQVLNKFTYSRWEAQCPEILLGINVIKHL